jgi:A/G-specific adenine glycosylase
MADTDIQAFQRLVLDHYRAQGRHDLPWRQPEASGHFDPYKILVSELMLQQTQVPRVIPKFLLFTEAFPSFESLAVAPLSDVLKMWSGLGYNRRAKFLLQAAQVVSAQHKGLLPNDHAELIALPGVGANTAGAIRAYAFNEQVVFIETNIRTVFIHHFFPGEEKVDDKELVKLIENSMTGQDARAWYWALMDYGTHLKQNVGNAAKASATYNKQSKFEGSRRQIRGAVLKLLAEDSRTLTQLKKTLPDERLEGVLQDLMKEGFVVQKGSAYQLSA